MKDDRCKCGHHKNDHYWEIGACKFSVSGICFCSEFIEAKNGKVFV